MIYVLSDAAPIFGGGGIQQQLADMQQQMQNMQQQMQDMETRIMASNRNIAIVAQNARLRSQPLATYRALSKTVCLHWAILCRCRLLTPTSSRWLVMAGT